jgi:phosphatidylethanolamine/phosphatidyl-N-methylethanolamine N-methyltransferase
VTFLPKSIVEKIKFFCAWIQSPASVASVVPSSKELAAAMIEAGELSPGQRILELGPGTGVFTRALLEAGIEEQKLVLVEYSPEFANQLKQDFPKATIIEGDAFLVLKELKQNGELFSAVLSGLPLLMFSEDVREDCIRESLEILRPGSYFCQFTYSPTPLVPDNSEWEAKVSERIWQNIPPAVVWSYRKTTD